MASPNLRTYLLAVMLALGLGASFSARAQDGSDGGLPSTTDAGSAGEGGADRDNPEGDDSTGRVVSACRTSRDCSPRFSCQRGSCTYTGIHDAERVGCLGGPEAAIGLAGLGLVALWRRRRS